MAFFDWSDDYSVGVTEMDNQHKHLIDIINELNDATMSGNSSSALSSIFDKLLSYTDFHFGNEERLMIEHGYGGLLNQQSEHRKLVDELRELQKNFQSGTASVNFQTMSFLRSWLYDHILTTDKQYGPFFNSKGVS